MLTRLFLLIILLCPSFAQATIFWDDEMESQTSFYFADWFVDPPGDEPAIYTHDTTVKFSGSGSLRVNFPLRCDVTSLSGQCGGSLTRTFPDRVSVYKRVYFMMSGSSTPLTAPNSNCITANCLFKTSQLSSTKMFHGQSLENNAFTEKKIRHWWQMGKNGGKTFINSQELVPTYTTTTDEWSSIVLQDNRWYCIETHEVVNYPAGTATGIAQAWVDGVQVLNDTNVIWQRAASSTAPGNFLWHQFQLVRQNGAGYFWFDRFAAGDERIPCIGSPPIQDTTPPTPPTSMAAQ